MFNHTRLIEEARRVLSLPSHSESGNEEVARYFQALMHDLGFKTSLQPILHSQAGLSKRQFNLLGFSSDSLVDRSTRRGLLMINPLDVTPTGGQVLIHDDRLLGVGAVQGKLDFLCRIIGVSDLIQRRHKVPLYLVGAAASHVGMLGSRFLIESLAVNPKEVMTFAPTQLQLTKQGAGHACFAVDVFSATRDRDTRGYNRCVRIVATGLSMDFAEQKDGINAFELLMDLLMDASSRGFDYQWSQLEANGADGANPDRASAEIFLTSFQFEDFKQFIRSQLDPESGKSFFKIDYVGVQEQGVRFLSPALIEVILELDFEWKAFLKQWNQKTSLDFSVPESVGLLTRVIPPSESPYSQQAQGKTELWFEVRNLPIHPIADFERQWKEKIQSLFSKYRDFSFVVRKERWVPATVPLENDSSKNCNYLSDAGWFAKSKFPVTIVGLGSTDQYPKSPKEFVSFHQLDEAIRFYREYVLSVCL